MYDKSKSTPFSTNRNFFLDTRARSVKPQHARDFPLPPLLCCDGGDATRETAVATIGGKVFVWAGVSLLFAVDVVDENAVEEEEEEEEAYALARLAALREEEDDIMKNCKVWIG